MYEFNSEVMLVGDMKKYDQAVVKKEPMFFSSSVSYAKQNGGEITRDFLSKLGILWDDGIFDSRVHMLMPGWYPCIPGYHHDDVPRSTPNGQPNYDSPEYKSEHVMATVNGGICPTYYIPGKVFVPPVDANKKVYEEWHKRLCLNIDQRILREEALPSEKLIQFDWQMFHRGSKAVRSGWRWFGRISRNTNRKITNEIRTQVQVYLDNPNEGW